MAVSPEWVTARWRGYSVTYATRSRVLADLAGGHADGSWELRLRRWAKPSPAKPLVSEGAAVAAAPLQKPFRWTWQDTTIMAVGPWQSRSAAAEI